MTKPAKSHGRISIKASAKPRALLRETPDIAAAWKAKVITLFPDAFPGVLGQSLSGKALHDGVWSLETIDLRQFGMGRHRDVDDTPAGGGAGMVMRADVLGAAIQSTLTGKSADRSEQPIIYLSPRGAVFDQSMARDLSAKRGVTLICGRFEGVDQRVLDEFDVREVSMGDYVLSGGEIAAQALIDATVRLIPGVLGNSLSTAEESFSNGLLEYPQYTRPADWMGHKIPSVLLSGHHARVKAWRKKQSEALTKDRRPDLWRSFLDSGAKPKR